MTRTEPSAPRVIATIQARCGSTRLPQKVLADLYGAPMVQRLAERVAASEQVDGVVIATTSDPSDDALAEFATTRSWPCYRGSVDDVLGRCLEAAESQEADVVVRIWGDCPFVCPEVVDAAVALLIRDEHDYVTNSLLAGRTWPAGLDIEVYRAPFMRRLATEPDPFFREFPADLVARLEKQGEASVGRLRADADHADIHLTVDYAEDLALARDLYGRLWSPERHFTVEDLLRVVLADRDALAATESLSRNADYLEKQRAHDE